MDPKSFAHFWRSILSTGSLVFAGAVPEGARVRFSSSFGHEIIEKSVRDITGWHRNHPRADLILLFSCMARHHVSGPMIAEEISAASDLWNAPLIGLFTYGEIGHNLSGTCDFYNETLSLVVHHFLPDQHMKQLDRLRTELQPFLAQISPEEQENPVYRLRPCKKGILPSRIKISSCDPGPGRGPCPAQEGHRRISSRDTRQFSRTPGQRWRSLRMTGRSRWSIPYS